MIRHLLISIVTPSYNQGEYIEDAILSVKSQNYKNFEHIIVDGGSNDKTIDIIKKYEKTYNLKWVSEPDKGPPDAINKGFNLAKGEIFAWINTDDYYEPGVFESVDQAFSSNPDIDLVIGDSYYFAQGRKKVLDKSKKEISFEKLVKEGQIGQPAIFFSSRAFKKAGPLDINLKYTFDYDLWIRLFKQGIKYKYINKTLAVYRPHRGALTYDNREKCVKEMYLVAKKYSPNSKFLPQIIKYPVAKYSKFFSKFQEMAPGPYSLMKKFLYKVLNRLS